MGNLIQTLKKFLTNKNTVTILGVIAGVIVLWVFYNMRVNEAISPTKVPIANREILATEEITKDDISYVEVNNELLKKAKVITNANQLIGYYVNVGTSVPEGGMFYTSQIVEKKELPNSITDQIPDGYTLYQLKVTNDTTFANSIYPGDRIDLFLKTTVDGKIVYGCFIESIEVLAVRDSSGQNVFDSSTNRTPAWLLFAVPSDTNKYPETGELYHLLKSIEFVSGMQLFPVPRNKMYTADAGETQIKSDYLRDLVESYTLAVPDDQ